MQTECDRVNGSIMSIGRTRERRLPNASFCVEKLACLATFVIVLCPNGKEQEAGRWFTCLSLTWKPIQEDTIHFLTSLSVQQFVHAEVARQLSVQKQFTTSRASEVPAAIDASFRLLGIRLRILQEAQSE